MSNDMHTMKFLRWVTSILLTFIAIPYFILGIIYSQEFAFSLFDEITITIAGFSINLIIVLVGLLIFYSLLYVVSFLVGRYVFMFLIWLNPNRKLMSKFLSIIVLILFVMLVVLFWFDFVDFYWAQDEVLIHTSLYKFCFSAYTIFTGIFWSIIIPGLKEEADVSEKKYNRNVQKEKIDDEYSNLSHLREAVNRLTEREGISMVIVINRTKDFINISRIETKFYIYIAFISESMKERENSIRGYLEENNFDTNDNNNVKEVVVVEMNDISNVKYLLTDCFQVSNDTPLQYMAWRDFN